MYVIPPPCVLTSLRTCFGACRVDDEWKLVAR